jgi:hypothetical protein
MKSGNEVKIFLQFFTIIGFEHFKPAIKKLIAIL